jgi:hypothetical protein
MSIGFWRLRDSISVRCMVLADLDRDLLFRRDAVERQALAADGLDVLRPEVDQGDVLAGMGEPAADISAQRADADDRDSLLGHDFLLRTAAWRGTPRLPD